MNKIHAYQLDTASRSHYYPKGTKFLIYKTNYRTDWGHVLHRAFQAWRNTYGTLHKKQDLSVVVEFTSEEVIIEISNRKEKKQ